MVKSLLYTDILSEYLKGHDQTVIGHAARYSQQFRIFTFTSVTAYEIVGFRGARSAPKRKVHDQTVDHEYHKWCRAGVNPGLKRLPARFYRSDTGREPVREWLKDLQPEDRKAIRRGHQGR